MIKLIYLLALATLAMGAPNAIGDNFEHPPARISDELEVARLGQEQAKFGTFCLETRDLVHEYLEQRDQRDFTTFVLNILFASADKIGLEPYTHQREQTEKLAAKIRDSDNNLADLEISPMVHLPSEEKFAYLALFGALDRTKNSATRETLNKLDHFREVFGSTNMHKRLTEACGLINRLEFALWNALNDYLNKVQVAADRGLFGVRCATSRKVAHLNRICQFALHAPTVQTELNYVPSEAVYE